MRRLPKQFIIAACVMVASAVALLLWLPQHLRQPQLRWHAVDGRWTESNGIISVLTYGRGDLQVAGKDSWRNYSLSADLRYDLLFPETHYGDAGLAVRVSNASEGVDSYQGYYAGLRADDQTLMFGRADFGWVELAKTRMPHPVRMGEWYHMQIDADGCRFTVTATDPSGSETRLVYTDHDCKLFGAVGLRSFYTQSSWRNVAVRRW